MTENQDNTQNHQNLEDDEISIAELFQILKSWLSVLWSKRVTIFVAAIIGMLIGLFIAFGTDDEYTAENVILSYTTQQQSLPGGQLGALGALSGLAGMDLNRSSDALISEAMFPRLLQTYPTASRLADKPIRFIRPDTTISAFVFFSELYEEDLNTRTKNFIRSWTIEIPYKVIRIVMVPIRWLNSNDKAQTDTQFEREQIIINGQQSSTSEQEIIDSSNLLSNQRPLLQIESQRSRWVNEVRKRIQTERSGRIITVKAIMPDPWAAADLANAATLVLMQELTNYEIRKTQDQIRFLENQYDEIFERFDRAQRDLIAHRDRSTGVVSSIVQIEAERVQSEYARASTRYTALVTELDRAKSRLNEETPLFTELDPVQVPQQPSSPNRERTILVWIVLGVSITVSFEIARLVLGKLTEQK